MYFDWTIENPIMLYRLAKMSDCPSLTSHDELAMGPAPGPGQACTCVEIIALKYALNLTTILADFTKQ